MSNESLQEPQAPQTPKKAGCLVALLFLIISIVIDVVPVMLAMKTGKKGFYLIGTIAAAIYGIVIFAIPYLRRNSLIRWWAILAFLGVALDIYCLIS